MSAHAGAVGEVTFRFYAELNDHLPARSPREICVRSDGPEPVGELIEKLGIPLTEVDLIVLDGSSIRPDREVGAGDRVAVYPVFESFDVSTTSRIRRRGLRELRFLLDTDLQELANLLQDRDWDVRTATWKDVVGETERLARILLTRKQELLDDPRLTHGLRMTGTTASAQLVDLARRLHLQM